MMTKKIAVIAGATLGLISYFLAIYGFQPTLDNRLYWAFLFIGFAFLLAYIISIIIFLAIHKKGGLRIINFWSAPKKPIYFLKKSMEYRFETRTKLSFRKEFEVVAKQKNVRDLPDRYTWSKDRNMPCRIEALNPNDTIVPEGIAEYWHEYTIQFSRNLEKNKPYQTGIIMPELIDDEKKSQLFLSSGIYEPTKELYMKVVIQSPLRFKKGSAKLLVYHTYFARYPSKEYPLEIKAYNNGANDTGFYIEHRGLYPITGACYKITWEFDE